jgi:hypothetical protein
LLELRAVQIWDLRKVRSISVSNSQEFQESHTPYTITIEDVFAAMVNIPSPIIGNIGSRIRLILGDTGNEWLLITDNDDGD